MQIVILRSNRLVAIVEAPGENATRVVTVLQELLGALGLELLTCLPYDSVQEALHKHPVAARPLLCENVERLQRAINSLLRHPRDLLVESEERLRLAQQQNRDLYNKLTAVTSAHSTLSQEIERVRIVADNWRREAMSNPAKPLSREEQQALDSPRTAWATLYDMTAQQELRLRFCLNGGTDPETGIGPQINGVTSPKVVAIKLLRAIKGGEVFGLREAKDAVEQLTGEKPLP